MERMTKAMFYKIGRVAMALASWKYSLLILMFGIATFACFQTVYNTNHNTGPRCPHISTYHVFKYSYLHMIEGENLYVYHHEDHCYTYKYSPAFALFFGIFGNFPDWLGLWLWLLISASFTFWAIRSLPGTSPPKQFLFFAFVSFEFLLSASSQQTNALLVSLLLLAFALLEQRKYLPATLFIVVTGFIKIFGFGALLLLLFYPQKSKLFAYTVGWVVFFALVPLLVVSPAQLWMIYGDWYTQIIGDHEKYAGMSLYSMLNAFTGIEQSKTLLLGASLLLILGTAAQYKKWNQIWFRQVTMASLLIWMVVFNHKAESPSYLIAMFGMAIWFFSGPRKWYDILLFLLAFVGVSLCFSDIIPKSIREAYFYAYSLKALPCFVVWLRVIAELWIRNETTSTPLSTQSKPIAMDVC